MRFRKKRLFKIAFLLILLLTFLLLRPQSQKEEEPIPAKIQPLLSSIFVNESARFHPLLRSGTYNPIDDEKLDELTTYIVVNAKTGEVYSAKDATKKVSPASLTKLMTAMIALDVASPSAKLLASGNAATQEPTVLGVKPGEQFTLEELIPALIMTSANDAATIIGEEVLREYGGNEKIFVEFMNRKAELLGLGKTHFANTQGFDDPNQYTNAFDLSRIAHYAYENYLLIRKAAAIQYATIEKNEDHGFYHLPSWNALLGTYPGVDGLKIGYTEEAGYCTAVTATKDDKSMIVIVMGAEGIIERDLAAATLLNYAFEKEGERGVTVNKSLIQPRIDEWNQLRTKILKEIELEKEKQEE